jgi:hypothetical protein
VAEVAWAITVCTQAMRAFLGISISKLEDAESMPLKFVSDMKVVGIITSDE